MLGLFVLSLIFLSLDHPRPVLAAVPFVLSLCFKQMALYYAPAMFIYLLSLSLPRLTSPNLRLLLPLSLTVTLTFAIVFAPFYLPTSLLSLTHPRNLLDLRLWFGNCDLGALLQIFRRVFPFGRGLWEDKVANTWCATNTLIKWRELYSTPTLQLLRSPSPLQNLTNSLVATMAAIAPGLVFIARYPLVNRLPEVFTLTSLGFYLFSFQVHEKSILLCLAPGSLLLFRDNAEERKWSLWINCIATIRYFPLLIFGNAVCGRY